MGKLKIIRKGYFLAGIALFLFLIISDFINLEVDSGSNYRMVDTLLGLIIFHNPFILGLYLLIAIIFVFVGLKRKIK
jgi:hypothetical protein